MIGPGGTSKGNEICDTSDAERRRERQVLLDDVLPARDVAVLACRTRPPRARAAHRRAKPTTRAAPENRASTADLSSPWKSSAASYRSARSRRSDARQLAPLAGRIDRDACVDPAHQIHDLAVPRIDEPVDLRRRQAAPQRRHGGHGVHDVAERAEPDDQDLHVRRHRARARGRAARAWSGPWDRRRSRCARRTRRRSPARARTRRCSRCPCSARRA